MCPSVATLILFAVISVGKIKSSKIESWTAVKVLDLGLGCWTRDLRPGFPRIRRWPMKMTWRSENFFSSSRVSLRKEGRGRREGLVRWLKGFEKWSWEDRVMRGCIFQVDELLNSRFEVLEISRQFRWGFKVEVGSNCSSSFGLGQIQLLLSSPSYVSRISNKLISTWMNLTWLADPTEFRIWRFKEWDFLDHFFLCLLLLRPSLLASP